MSRSRTEAGSGSAGQLVDDLGESLEGGRPGGAARPAVADRRDALPGRQEPGEGRRIDRLDLLAEPGQRAAAEQAEDVGVDPLALGAARPELAAEDRAGGEQPLQRVLDDAGRQAPAAGRLGRQERAVGPGVAGEQPVERADRRAEERLRARPVGGETPTPSR